MHYLRLIWGIVLATLLLTAGCPLIQAIQFPVLRLNPGPEATAAVAETSVADVPTPATVVPYDPPNYCPVTQPPDPPFIPPPPYPTHLQSEYWYGTESLWTSLPLGRVWSGLPHNPEGYTQKVFWWRKSYNWRAEPEPNLVVSGQRLDAAAPPLNVSRATNAFAEDIQSAMLVGVDFPTLGCWKITGRYRGTELSFVIWVAP
jgi:hypothetical protein